MEILEKIATPNTPYVNFNPNIGRMLIKGRAIPENIEEFWSPIVKWFYAYSCAPVRKTRIIFHMEYFNNASSKQILFLLHKMNEMVENGYDVSIEWRYAEDDDEMKEAGFDFSCVVNVPFVFNAFRTEGVDL
ncbi:MAG: DUF1987 domain-containing protein [Brumimicrobium sp.]|nr:DUF1987 domain-containing protein [Brumimicrobium sp.]MCO5268396.1 DUF1987 domain-containing protein [Brumimicrobium sp.]